MLDIKRIRNDLEGVRKLLLMRNKGDYEIDKVFDLDKKRREQISVVEQMQSEHNKMSKKIPVMKKQNEDTTEILSNMKKLSDDIKLKNDELKETDEKIRELLLNIPNTLNPNTPIGNTDEDNVEVKKHLEPTKFNFEPKAHWDLVRELDIIDFDRATKISGSRFYILKNDGARLERALISFMLDLHTKEHGFDEFLTPVLVNRKAMTGTGQLPKFEEDVFHIPQKDMFLIPTAEVSLTNMLMDEIVENDKLPLYYTGYTPCFRQEAGSAGRDTRGVIRVHQFNKVELVKFVEPKTSYDELESLLKAAEEVLKRLNLPYRVVRLCSGDVGFSGAMTYDIEVWMPSYNRYLEISSCTNFEDYQARRANIRYRDENKKANFLHTLNGSGVAIGRAFAAIVENYQNEDGTITVPEVLVPYMGKDIIKK